jgi:hypothetical protein
LRGIIKEMKKTNKIIAKIMLFCITLSYVVMLGTPNYSAKSIDGSAPIQPAQYQKLLGKGMDVDWSKTNKGREAYREKAVKDFKAAGIQHVRIRVKDDVSDMLLKSLDQQIQDCLEYGVIPIIAYQANGFKNDVSEEEMDKVVSWWTKIAEHYQDTSYLVAFDMMIECTDALNKNPEKLNELYEKVVTAIRKSNPQRILMMSPRVRSDAQYLKELKVPTEANGYMMAEWHFYASGPSKENERKLWTKGTEKEKGLIREKIRLALEWQKQTGIPTWVGAWMAGNYNDENYYSVKEQVAFAHFMVTELGKAGIPFAVNADTHFYNRDNGTWVKDMLPLRYCIYSSYSQAVKALFTQSSNKVSKITKKSTSSVAIEWTKLDWSKQYLVEVSTSKSFKHKTTYSLSGNKKTVTGLKKGNHYYVRVRGCYTIKGKKVYSKYSTMKQIR